MNELTMPEIGNIDKCLDKFKNLNSNNWGIVKNIKEELNKLKIRYENHIKYLISEKLDKKTKINLDLTKFSDANQVKYNEKIYD